MVLFVVISQEPITHLMMIIPGSFTKRIVCKCVDKVWAIKGEFIVTWDNNSSKQLHVGLLWQKKRWDPFPWPERAWGQSHLEERSSDIWLRNATILRQPCKRGDQRASQQVMKWSKNPPANIGDAETGLIPGLRRSSPKKKIAAHSEYYCLEKLDWAHTYTHLKFTFLPFFDQIQQKPGGNGAC